MAGKLGFYDFKLEVGGRVNDDWVEPDLRYGKPLQSSLSEELGISDDYLESWNWRHRKTAAMTYQSMLGLDQNYW